MELKTIVKVGQINNLSDARYCAGMGAQLLGFNLIKNTQGYLSPESYKEITDWVEGPMLIGEFNGTNADIIRTALKEYSVKGIQLDVACDTSVIKEYDGVKILKINFSESISDLENTILSNPGFDYYLIDSDHKIALKPVVFEGLKTLTVNHKILLGVGLNIDEIDQIILNSGVAGIHLKGGREERPGWAEVDELADYLEHLEVEY